MSYAEQQARGAHSSSLCSFSHLQERMYLRQLWDFSLVVSFSFFVCGCLNSVCRLSEWCEIDMSGNTRCWLAAGLYYYGVISIMRPLVCRTLCCTPCLFELLCLLPCAPWVLYIYGVPWKGPLAAKPLVPLPSIRKPGWYGWFWDVLPCLLSRACPCRGGQRTLWPADHGWQQLRMLVLSHITCMWWGTAPHHPSPCTGLRRH